MAGKQRKGRAGKAHRTNRRTFIQTVGVTATTTAVGTAATGAVSGAERTVDLGEQGLRNGDLIDPYLEEFFVDGTEVRVPAGEYDYTGDGLGGEKADCALVGSPDGVTLTRPGDSDGEVRPTITATRGMVRIENITIREERGGAQSRWRVIAEPGTTVELLDVTLPDRTLEVFDRREAHSVDSGQAPAAGNSGSGPVESETGNGPATETQPASPVDIQPLPVDTGGGTDEGPALGHGDTTGLASRPSRIEVEGTGDAREGTSYELSVTGDLSLDEGHTAVGDGESLWLDGDITEGYVSGHLRDGVDAFYYSGTLEHVELDGDAAVTVFHGGHGFEE